MIDFETTYTHVRPTILRLMSIYYVKLWEKADWDQEGMLSLYQLLLNRPDLETNTSQLRIYFKTKFTNHLNDGIRKQENQKRRLNKLAIKDISEIAHLLPQREILLDDLRRH